MKLISNLISPSSSPCKTKPSTMSSSTIQTTHNRRQLYRQTFGILNANSLHFVTIALLFLPFSFSAYAAVQLYSSSGNDFTPEFDPFNLLLIKAIVASSQNLLAIKTLIVAFAFTCFVILPAVAGTALITYSTIQAIYGKPLTFSSTIESLSHSYIPLLSTVIVGSMKLILLFLLFTLLPMAITEAIKALGFHFDLFIFSVFINTVVSFVLPFTMLLFIVIWGSAAAIAVLESKSGFEPLRQSANQSTEFRYHSFSIVFISGFAIGTSMYSSAIAQNIGSTTNWILILQVGAICLFSSLMISLYAVANTVLYVQCKVARGEEITKTTVEGDVSGEYVMVVANEEDDEVLQEPTEKVSYGGFTYTIYFFQALGIFLVIFNTIIML